MEIDWHSHINYEDKFQKSLERTFLIRFNYDIVYILT